MGIVIHMFQTRMQFLGLTIFLCVNYVKAYDGTQPQPNPGQGQQTPGQSAYGFDKPNSWQYPNNPSFQPYGGTPHQYTAGPAQVAPAGGMGGQDNMVLLFMLMQQKQMEQQMLLPMMLMMNGGMGGGAGGMGGNNMMLYLMMMMMNDDKAASNDSSK